MAQATMAPPAPLNQDQFEDWLTRMANTFKTAVEDNGLWTALWDDPQSGRYVRHRRQKIAQVIARSAWLEHCKPKLDITHEADCGRGPVGFKFTQGWTMRGLIEVKHIENNQFTHGATAQLPTYLKGEEAAFGIYLCIGYSDRDFDPDRLAVVQAACTAYSAQGKTRIVPLFVEARPKPSASKA
jgi:hypothetical protein